MALADRPVAPVPPGSGGPVPFEYRWKCRVCRTVTVVPTLARDHERACAEALGIDLEDFLADVRNL